MKWLTKLRRDEQGVAAMEMAFALPVLLLFVFGIFQIGVILQANAGMQHALGEGARLATLYPKRTDAVIVAKMDDSEFGMSVGTFNTPTISTPATSVCANCRDLQVTYTVTPNFVFFTAPQITLTRNKRVYTAG
ncbi:MAG: pilus assembly protein [Pseudomonadota bacterium]|nr:pilus assembly protein [Pseudomonadota bacterium]